MRVLVVDDDEAIRTALRRGLVLEGHDVALAEDGTSALRMLRTEQVDAIVLDWMLPDLDGVEVCRRVRSAGDTVPIVMLTARGLVDDRIEGLDAGADDYLVKPFDLDELCARLRAVTRRAGQQSDHGASSAQPMRLAVADLVLDAATMTGRRGSRQFSLSRTELALLELFMRHPGTVLGRSQILREVWNYDFGGRGDNLDVYISYLRRKTEDGGEHRVIHTVRSVGYVLRVDG